MFVLFLLLPGIVSAQTCRDSTTLFWYQGPSVFRTSTNNVQQKAAAWVTGDYYYLWSTGVTATAYKDSVARHSGSATAPAGQGALIYWDDAPSSTGTGYYSVTEMTYYESPCESLIRGPFTSGEQIDKPTITLPADGIFAPTSLWNLGPGTDNYIPTGDYAYRQAITITVNNHCSEIDTCTDTPTWTINSPASTLVLSPTTGTSVSLSKGTAMGNCKTDTPVTVSLGGFSSDSTTFGVNSPGQVVSRPELAFTENYNTGYRSNIYWAVTDVCPGGADRLTSLPYYEAFQNWQFPGVINGWGADAAESNAGFNYDPDPTVFRDQIWAFDTRGTWNPHPVWTSEDPPYTYNTIIQNAAHQYYVGTTTAPGGTRVFNGNLWHYRDHGYTF